MSRQITLELPDELVERAERLATLSHRDVNQVIADAVAVALPPFGTDFPFSPVHDLPDAEVRVLADLQMPPDKDRRLSELLYERQARGLTEQEQIELMALMRMYEIGLLRKTEGLVEAVRRGLRPPLSA